jgi:hypothetical protein
VNALLEIEASGRAFPEIERVYQSVGHVGFLCGSFSIGETPQLLAHKFLWRSWLVDLKVVYSNFHRQALLHLRPLETENGAAPFCHRNHV